MENLSLIDMSSEDDLLLSSSSDCNRDLKSTENCEGNEAENLVKMSKQWEYIPEMSESPEQKQAKSGKVNLRKSLAWDNAFLTSEGVLNTEELGIVNSTFRKTEACSLPKIQEELRKSSESTSTLDSESYTLDNLEGDLFNLRASIQMSVGRRDNSSSVVPVLSRLGARKKMELPSQKVQMKPPMTLRRDGMSKQQIESTSKEAVSSVNEVTKRIGNSKLLLKPPRIVMKSTSTSLLTDPINIDSSASLHLINSTKKTSSGVGSIRKTNGDSGNTTSRSISTSKPTPLNKSPLSTAANFAIKSPLENSRKRTATRITDNSLSKSTISTPGRTSRNKLGSSNYTLKFSSKASPSSSLESFASEASSSSTSISSVKPSNSVESFTSSNSSSPSLVSKKQISPNNVQRRAHIAKASLGIRGLSEPSNRDNATKSSTNNNTGAKSSKPTGLRMPSPKIGYFDSEKTLISNSTKIPHGSIRSSLIKGTIENSSNVGANKLKSKIPSIRPASKPVCMNSDSSQARSSPIKKEDGRMVNQLHSTSDKIEKENKLPACEADELIHDVMQEKMYVLSLSEKTDLVGGD